MIEFKFDNKIWKANSFDDRKAIAMFEQRLIEQSRAEATKSGDAKSQSVSLAEWRTQFYQGQFREGKIAFISHLLTPIGVIEALFCCVASASKDWTEDLHRQAIADNSLASVLTPLIEPYITELARNPPKAW